MCNIELISRKNISCPSKIFAGPLKNISLPEKIFIPSNEKWNKSHKRYFLCLKNINTGIANDEMMTECARCWTRVSARGGQAAAGSSGSEHCRAPPPRLSRPAPVPLPRTAVVCFLTSTCTALNLRTSEIELKISIPKHLEHDTHNTSNYNSYMVGGQYKYCNVFILQWCGGQWCTALLSTLAPSLAVALSSPRWQPTVQRRQWRGADRRLQSSVSWSRRSDATIPWPPHSHTEVSLILVSLWRHIPQMLYVKSLGLNCPLLFHQEDRE